MFQRLAQAQTVKKYLHGLAEHLELLSLLRGNSVKINNAYKTSVHKYERRLGKPAGKPTFRLNDYINIDVDKDYVVQVWTGWIHPCEGGDLAELL